MTEFDPNTFSSVEPEQFAAMVKSASKEQLEVALTQLAD